MLKRLKSPYIAVIAVLSSLFQSELQAQQDMMLYNLSQIPQSVYANPGIIPETRVNISIPGANGLMQAGKSQFHTTEAFYRDEVDNRLRLDGRDMINSFQDRNSFRSNSSVDLIHIGFEAGLNYIHFNVTEHAGFNLDFPREASILIREVYEQNFLGQNIHVQDIRFNLQHYREFGAGFARRLSKRFSVGARVKYFYGVSTFSTTQNSFRANTDISGIDENAVISGGLAYSAQSAGLNNYRSEGGNAGLFFGGGNSGFSTDLGLNYEVSNFMTLSAAVQNLGGFINWSDNVRNFEQPNRDITLNLLELPEAFDGELTDRTEITTQVANLLDSLMGDDASENDAGFTTKMPTRVNLAAAFNVTSALTFTFLNQNVFIEDFDNLHFVKVMMQAKLKRTFTAIVAYDLINDFTPGANLGLGFALNIGAFQLYALSEDVLFVTNTNDRVTGSVRFGMNLTFGRDNL